MWLKLCGISENEMKDKQIFKPRGYVPPAPASAAELESSR